MFKVVLKVFVITVMLVAFVGQAIAFNTAMSCETSVDSFSPKVSELVKHYDSNVIDTNSPDDCCGIECCDIECSCIANACSSFLYFHSEVVSTKIAYLSDVVFMQPPEHPKAISTLLYRPPIFSS